MRQLSLIFLLSISALGALRAQSGSFIIPGIRDDNGTDFAYWDLFARPPGSPDNVNYNYPNPPALADGLGEDDDSNPTTVFAPRATLTQNGSPNSFLTSSGAIYSFSDTLAFETEYTAPVSTAGEITNVIFQTQTGGSRLNVNGIQLRYVSGGQTFNVNPLYRALDDPQSGAFSERIVCAFQWNLTGLNVRQFKIVFAAPGPSMPLWQAQLDAVTGQPFVQELGYLLATRSRPLTRFGRAGVVDKNLPVEVDGRYFLPGANLNLLSDPESGWASSGWHFNGTPTTGTSLPLIFPAQDITVTALFSPQNYPIWRTAMFNHANALLGTENDFSNDAISLATVDHESDGLVNAGEYAFAGDPYEDDDVRTRPQMLVVDVGGVLYPALRYRTNGAQAGVGDCVFNVRVSGNGGTTWSDNNSVPGTTQTHSRHLQSDGSELIIVRTVAALSSFSSVLMDVDWSAAGVDGEPRAPLSLAITTAATLPAGTMGVAYAQGLDFVGGAAPYAWSISAGSLPGGLTINNATGQIAGTPLVSGPQSFTVQLLDALGTSVTRDFTLALAPFEMTTDGALSTTAKDAPFSQQLQVTGGTGPYSWSLVSGSTLPPGITLTGAGLLSGTPTVLGNYVFTIEVTDATPITVSRSFTLRIIELGILTQALPVGVINVAYSTMLSGTGGTTPYTWTVINGEPPAGITLKPGGVLSGTSTAATESTFTVQLQDADGFTVTRQLTVTVSASFLRPVMQNPAFPAATIGVNYSHPVPSLNYPKTYTATGLPRGLKINATSGLVTGRPEVVGIFNVQLQGSNSAGKSLILTVPLVVKGLDKELIGSYTAWSTRDQPANGRLGSRFELITTSKGGYTLKAITGAKTVSFAGFLAGVAPQINVTLNAQPLALTLSDTTGAIAGTHGAATITGWRSTWHAASNPADSREGYYSFALDLADQADDGILTVPQGSGFATFTVTSAGAVKISGKTADGETITSACVLGPEGQICLYGLLYKNLGSILGGLVLSEDAEGTFENNAITGNVTWFKPATPGARTYANTFGPLNINASGKYLAATAKEIVLGLPDTGIAQLLFTDGGLALADQDPDIAFSYTDDNKVTLSTNTQVNPTKLALVINKNTGAVSGSFTLVEPAPVSLIRAKVPFSGQVVRHADGSVRAVGYFLLPQIPAGTQKPASTNILSGGFRITQ